MIDIFAYVSHSETFPSVSGEMVLELFGEKWAKNLALLIEKVSSKLTELTELTERQTLIQHAFIDL